MSKVKSYAEIENELPLIVRSELQKHDDIYQHMFAEEYSKKRKTKFGAYGCMFLLSAHRWYLGSLPMTILQWITILAVVGFGWLFIDLFLIPGMVREVNADIAEDLAKAAASELDKVQQRRAGSY